MPSWPKWPLRRLELPVNADSPLVFRPSSIQRALAALLCAGSWLVGGRTLVFLTGNLPRMLATIRMAEISGDPVFWPWAGLVVAVGACVAGGALLLLSVLGLLLIESSQVLVDELGISVDYAVLPGPLARRFGAGRLTWKQVGSLEKGRLFFIVRGGGDAPAVGLPVAPPLRFLVVDELERLVLLVLERSPNIKL